MSRRIVLVRHARSAHVHAGWIDHAGAQAWRAAYDAAGIGAKERPPSSLSAITQTAGVIVSSDLTRARATAALLSPGLEIAASALLRETELQIPSLGGLRLPLAGWMLAIAGRWIYGALRRDPLNVHERSRASDAAEWLATLTEQHGVVVAVTHGGFRRLLAQALVARGWQGPSSRSLRPWSAWSLTQAKPRASVLQHRAAGTPPPPRGRSGHLS